MKNILKFVICIVVIIVLLMVGAKLFPEPSWGGIAFYTIFFLGVLGTAGYWIINIK